MKYFILTLVILIGIAWYLFAPVAKNNPEPQVQVQTTEENKKSVEIIEKDLEIPWDIAFLPQGSMLVTERTGHLLRIKGKERHEIPIAGVRKGGEAGLLGVVVHPNFKENNFVYLYVSSSQAGENINRVERYVFKDDTLTDKKIIIDHVPGAVYHDGGRMEFGPDGLLYITTGDATKGELAQDKSSLAGKILRLKDDGSIPEDNPFHTAVYSYGHRNPQGLAWDMEGRLWETEHGPTGEQGLCCRDELNLIKPGGNYGWPVITADETKEGMYVPALHSGTDTWAPASLVYLGGRLYFGGLKGEALYEAVLDGEKVVRLNTHFKGQFGRIRTVRLGPDKMLYLTTSNRDGRGSPKAGDDTIVRIDPTKL